MDSLRKWFYKPKRDDRSLLAQFFFADEALNMVAAELDSFDGRENPERCSTLVNQLRHCQERVLNITGQIMDQLLGNERVPRGFRVKFPEDVLHENLAGQLWFGAECLAAGSSIMHREGESDNMRPLARALTYSLEKVRSQLRDHCLRCNRYGAPSPQNCTENLHESLKIFDRLFAEFELCYVSAMVPVKTPQEYEMQQLISVLFSETLQRARRIGLLTQDQVDDYDPALMFAIPRLAIVSGLLMFSNGPLSIDKSPELMSDMFRPFRNLLHKIRELLWTLDKKELYLLEKLLCTNEDIAAIRSNVDLSFNGAVPENVDGSYYPDISEFATRFYSEYSHCEDFFDDNASTVRMGDEGRETDRVITEADYLPDNIEVLSPLIDGLERLNQVIQIDEENFDTTQLINGDSSIEINYCNTPGVDAIYLDNTFQEENTNLDVGHDELDVNVNDNNREIDIDNLTVLHTERRNSNKSHGSSRKSSQNDCLSGHHTEFVRNLSNNALSIFDPLVSANTYPTTSECNSSMVESNLVLANPETETTHFDSSITNLLHNQVSGQIFSFSTNDVSNLVSTETDPEFNNVANNVTYSPSRNDKGMSQASMPSTSHGYLILNAISQEPVILASLANNNPAAFEDSLMNSMNNPLLMTQSSISMRDVENEILEENISVTNANLSCLLFTNENFHNNYVTQESTQNSCPEDVPTSHSNKKLAKKRAQFLVGYESDSNEQTPGDSGICTENTSLDRSPDSEVKDIEEKNREAQPKDDGEIPPLELENIKSFFFKYQENTENVEKNEAGPSCRIMQQPEFVQGHIDNTAKSSDISIIDNCAVSEHANNSETPCDNNLCSYNTTVNTNQNLDVTTPEIVLDSYDSRPNNNINNDKCDSKLSTDSNSCSENQKTLVAVLPTSENDSAVRQCSKNPSVVIEDSSPVACDTPSSASSVPEPSCSGSSSTAVLNQRKLRKSSPKHKKRSSKSRHSATDGKMWSPANVILRRAPKLKTPINLNLDQYVEDSVGGSVSSQSSATSSFHSDWADDEEIALALQAREFASRHQTRAKYRSSEDLIHRLFVCIAAVADQLQTNYASDLRNILKSVFLMNQTPEIEDDKSTDDRKETSSNSDETEQQTEREQPRSNRTRNNSSIEYEVSASEVLTNGDSFDSIHSAEEVYADNISPSPSSRLSEENVDENIHNDLNERRNSQHSDIDQSAQEHLNSSRRNTISSIISKTKQSSHASLQESTKMVNQEDESAQIEQPSSYDRSSSSSIDSNNSDNHNDDEANLLNEDNSNYINEQMDCRDNHQDIINDNACIQDMGLRSQSRYERAPEWVPDIAAPDCMRCGIHFTAFRRRHHCRNCGKVFCASCSANSIPLPRFGQLKPVRVCEECFQLIAKRTCNSRHISNTTGRQANYTHR